MGRCRPSDRLGCSLRPATPSPGTSPPALNGSIRRRQSARRSPPTSCGWPSRGSGGSLRAARRGRHHRRLRAPRRRGVRGAERGGGVLGRPRPRLRGPRRQRGARGRGAVPRARPQHVLPGRRGVRCVVRDLRRSPRATRPASGPSTAGWSAASPTTSEPPETKPAERDRPWAATSPRDAGTSVRCSRRPATRGAASVRCSPGADRQHAADLRA